MKRGTKIHSVVRAAIVIAGLSSLGACASIPERAWANGRAMTQSRAYQAVMAGDRSVQTFHQLNYSLNPRRLNYTELAYQPFSQWWY